MSRLIFCVYIPKHCEFLNRNRGYICIYVYTYICIYIYIYIYTYIHTYIHIYIYIHTHTPWKQFYYMVSVPTASEKSSSTFIMEESLCPCVVVFMFDHVAVLEWYCLQSSITTREKSPSASITSCWKLSCLAWMPQTTPAKVSQYNGMVWLWLVCRHYQDRVPGRWHWLDTSMAPRKHEWSCPTSNRNRFLLHAWWSCCCTQSRAGSRYPGSRYILTHDFYTMKIYCEMSSCNSVFDIEKCAEMLTLWILQLTASLLESFWILLLRRSARLLSFSQLSWLSTLSKSHLLQNPTGQRWVKGILHVPVISVDINC